MKIAAAQYDIAWLPDWDAYVKRAHAWVQAAADGGADLALFPEYFSMELASIFGPEVARSLSAQLDALQSLHQPFVELYAGLAAQHGLIICAGSFPVQVADGRYLNRSYLFVPGYPPQWQDKLQMTRFEREHWLIAPGEGLKVFQTKFGVLAINICYDSEFPLFAHAQVEAGAGLIFVPSCTDTLAGYWRVRIGCQARALEGQCFVVQSPTVGEADWSESVDVNVGAAAIYAPVDRGFPSDGLLAAGELNASQWVFADVDLAALDAVRTDGQVLNFRDWDGQSAHVGMRVERIRLD